MANVANCKKCGALFLQSGKRDICDKCFEEQNKLISEINSYVTLSGEQFIPVEDIMTKFNITRNEFEAFFLAGKFVRISNKVTIKCARNYKTKFESNLTLCWICLLQTILKNNENSNCRI